MGLAITERTNLAHHKYSLANSANGNKMEGREIHSCNFFVLSAFWAGFFSKKCERMRFIHFSVVTYGVGWIVRHRYPGQQSVVPNPFFVDDPKLGQLSSVNALTAEVLPLRIGLGSPAWLKMRGSEQGWFPHTLTELDCRCIFKYC